ncbi:EAL domain-containing protein [Thalassobius sp. Cn5-15]|uniref:EAL domain-containing protein n=1 Tax=Thalassobius sp. Cn5-15 TaxID=2917763 RepID=UPI001EF1C3B2|nr:EAL domain-containing protein [Thalassobius sp. Cn5-15]MCG7493393.1 EAL domain-containing protein [Thalassobius sp. Cn5-15]
MPNRIALEIPDELSNPLNYAVHQRGRDILDTVRAALKHGEVRLAYQPIVEAQRPDRIGFYEGLFRVLDADGRVIPARDFMPFAEDCDIGRDIDCSALEIGLTALSQVPGLRLSVNMSARSIGYPRWMQVLERKLADDPDIGARLILEITETSAMTVPELVQPFMRKLRAHGVAFALDDFGAGATSFRYLRDLRFDMVKIDQQFCRNAHRNRDDQALIRAMSLIADQFDMMTIAEGVENAGAANWLRDAGLHCLQGYHFSLPQLRPDWTTPARQRA